MKKLIVAGATGAALLASAFAFGPAAAQTPAVQPQPITACATIDASGSYIVSTDLQSTMSDCIEIAAPNVTLNLGSRTIAGGGTGVGVGVHILAGADNARVVNGTVSGFVYGVEADAPFAHIARMTLADNVTGGVLLSNASSSRIARSYALDNGAYGLTVRDSNGVSIVDSRTEGSGIYGIWLDNASYGYVAGNIVGPAGNAGIYLGCSPTGDFGERDCAAATHNLIEQNSIDAGNGIGIVLSVHADANVIVGNANSNGNYGAFDADAACGTNVWQGNSFTAANATCIA